MMRYIITGLLLLLGMILLAMFITACAPARTMTRDGYQGDRPVVQESKEEESDYSWGDSDDDAADTHTRAPKNARTARKEIAPSVRSGGSSKQPEDDLAVDDSENEGEEPASREKFYQKGEASWYGRAFHGKFTASGERFDMNRLTAAHKTLPFGTLLEVKNLNNDKSVKVRVNDRGPYRGGRILDLSYAAARRLDMLGAGRSNVGITILKKGNDERNARKSTARDDIEPVSGEDDNADDSVERSEKSAERGGGRVALQAGAFLSRNNADRLKGKIEGMTRNSVSIIRDGDLYKVRVSAFSSKKDARRVRDLLNEENISSFIVDDVRE